MSTQKPTWGALHMRPLPELQPDGVPAPECEAFRSLDPRNDRCLDPRCGRCWWGEVANHTYLMTEATE